MREALIVFFVGILYSWNKVWAITPCFDWFNKKKTVYREKEAVREAYNLFNEYADILYGSDKTNQEYKLYSAFKIIFWSKETPHYIYMKG